MDPAGTHRFAEPRARTLVVALLCLSLVPTLWAQAEDDWATEIRELAKAGKLTEALTVSEEWIQMYAEDLDAQAWHARILGWQGKWVEAEKEYRALLAQSPSDPDLLIGLAQILNYRQQHRRAMELLNRACPASSTRQDCRSEREHIRNALREDARHQIRISGVADLANYTQDGSAVSAGLLSRWTPQWRTAAAITQYRRFGQTANGIEAGVTYRLSRNDAVTVAAGSAGHAGIAPTAVAQIGFDHGIRLSAGLLRGLEAAYEQRWTWYPGTRILTLSPSVIAQLSKGCEWLLRFSSAHIGSAATNEWNPSFQTRFTFPIRRRCRAYGLFASGAEDFGTIDQILFRASRAAGGGLTIRTLQGQEFQIVMQAERIAGGRSKNTIGGGYALRF